MKVAMELVDNIGELTGVGPVTKLIKLIVNKASTERKQNRVCRKFARWLQIMEGLLKPLLKVPKLMDHPETRALLKELEESLEQAYLLVIKYKDRSYPYRFIMASDIAERFSDMRKEIKRYIDLIPVIKLFIDETIIHRVDTRSQGKEEEMDRKKWKNNEEEKKMDQKKRKNRGEAKNKGMVKGKKGMEENEKVEEKGRYCKGKEEKQRGKKKYTEMEELWKEQEEENDSEKQRSRDKYEKINAPPLVAKTAVLKVAMRCECNGCPGRIVRSIHKYPGVESSMVMEVDEGFASVTVVGHLDPEMLRDYVANKTKKEVRLVGNGGRERDDQLLKKTDSKSIGDGGKPPKGGNNNNTKKRVVPMVVAAKVVLKVGDTGLRCECNGCVDKIRDTLFKITGVQKVRIDTGKNQVTVTGTNMDIYNLREKLGNKVRRPVEVMQPGKH